MATNELGHRLAAAFATDRGDKYSGQTLGAYRRGKRIPWVPGATIDVWMACGRQESVTGVPWPHCYFIQTIGGPDGGSVHCPSCRAELEAKRVTKVQSAPPPPAQREPF